MLRASILALLPLLAGEALSQTTIPTAGLPTEASSTVTVALPGAETLLDPTSMTARVTLSFFHVSEGRTLEMVPGSQQQRDRDEVIHAATHASAGSALLLLSLSELLTHDNGQHRRHHQVVEHTSAFQEFHDLLVGEEANNTTSADQLEAYNMEDLTSDTKETSRNHFFGLDRIFLFGNDDKYVRSGERLSNSELAKDAEEIGYREETHGPSHYLGRLVEMVIPVSIALVLFSGALLIPTLKSMGLSAA